MTTDEKIDLLLSMFNKMDSRLGKLESDIISVKSSIENEVVPNIKIIAEGHIYANTYSNDAVHIANKVKFEQESYEIRLKILEHEFNELKQAISA